MKKKKKGVDESNLLPAILLPGETNDFHFFLRYDSFVEVADMERTDGYE